MGRDRQHTRHTTVEELEAEYERLLGPVQHVNECLQQLRRNGITAVEMEYYKAAKRAYTNCNTFLKGLVPATAYASQQPVELRSVERKEDTPTVASQEPPAKRLGPIWLERIGLMLATAVSTLIIVTLVSSQTPERIYTNKPIPKAEGADAGASEEVHQLIDQFDERSQLAINRHLERSRLLRDELRVKALQAQLAASPDERNRREETSERNRE